MTIYSDILQAKESGEKLLAVLIDPEKIELHKVRSFVQLVNQSFATHIFVGGSTDKENTTESVIIEIKKYTTLPVILFPGDAQQITSEADGVLFLSLISGRNPKYLIEQQVESALTIQKSNLEVIPTGYILIDGGNKTSVEKISQTNPIAQNDYQLILKTALAGQFLGKQLIYLEAGSGATEAVGQNIISIVSESIDIPLIVGGGIRNVEQLHTAYNAGADIVVIGTAFENNPAFFNELKKENINENIRRANSLTSSK